MELSINPTFNAVQTKEQYALDNRVRLSNFIDQDQAIELAKELHSIKEYNQAFALDDKAGETTREKLEALNLEERKELMQKIYRQASEGIGFWYGRQHIDENSIDPLSSFLAWINTDAFLDMVRQVTGIDAITNASAQVSRFIPGDFLTRHSDVTPEENRLVAYSMSFSPQWHPDWGGLLQFYTKEGQTRDAWAPMFNTLNLYSVQHIHAVTYVTPFAGGPRISLSGWFRGDV